MMIVQNMIYVVIIIILNNTLIRTSVAVFRSSGVNFLKSKLA